LSTNYKFLPVWEKVELLQLEGRLLKAGRLHFRIVHRFRAPGTDCAPGEEIFAIFLVYRGHEFFIPLDLTLRLLFDFFARHARVPQGASQIEASFRADPFCREHARNAPGRRPLTRKVSKSSVRVYVERICRALTLSFRAAHLRIDPRDVLVSEETVTNRVGYRLRGTFEWLHTDHQGPEFALVR